MTSSPFRNPFIPALAIVALPFVLVWAGASWVWGKVKR